METQVPPNIPQAQVLRRPQVKLRPGRWQRRGCESLVWPHAQRCSLRERLGGRGPQEEGVHTLPAPATHLRGPGRLPALCTTAIHESLVWFFPVCNIWSPDAHTAGRTRPRGSHASSVCLSKALLLPSRVVFCLRLRLPLLTASHRQQLRRLQNKSSQPTFQCLRNVCDAVRGRMVQIYVSGIVS